MQSKNSIYFFIFSTLFVCVYCNKFCVVFKQNPLHIAMYTAYETTVLNHGHNNLMIYIEPVKDSYFRNIGHVTLK